MQQLALLSSVVATSAHATSSGAAERNVNQRRPLSRGKSSATSATSKWRSSVIKPPALKVGDTVALITPGGFVDDAQIDKSISNLQLIGLKAKLLPNARAARGNFAGTVQQRVDDLHAAFADASVAALWAIRGGSGCAQILPSLDYALIGKHPKVVVGYSDITALLNALYVHCNLVTFHGPVASSTFTDYSVNHLRSILFEGAGATSPYAMHTAHDNDAKAAESPEYEARVLRGGVAEGRLIGGNLSVLAAMIGTPHAPAMNDALLFLEEIGEAPYRIDRLLTQIRQHCGASLPAAIVFGVLRKCGPAKDEASLTLAETLADFAASLPAVTQSVPSKIPCVSGYSLGHISHQMTLPIGIRARLDTHAQTVTLVEAAVS
jgi:muramoyltetrapeptide carboxypeptidase